MFFSSYGFLFIATPLGFGCEAKQLKEEWELLRAP